MLRLMFVIALALSPAAALAEEVATTPPPQLPAITVAPVTKATLTDRVIATGIVGPVEQVDVQPQIDGQAVDAVLAEVSDKVEAGQVLARLSRDTLNLAKSQLLASRASAAEARASRACSATNDATAVRDCSSPAALLPKHSS